MKRFTAVLLSVFIMISAFAAAANAAAKYENGSTVKISFVLKDIDRSFTGIEGSLAYGDELQYVDGSFSSAVKDMMFSAANGKILFDATSLDGYTLGDDRTLFAADFTVTADCDKLSLSGALDDIYYVENTEFIDLPKTVEIRVNGETVQDEPEPSEPAISKTSLSLKAGKTATLTVENAQVKSWKSAKKSIATVKNGKVTALKKGKSTITATLADGTKLNSVVTVTTSPALKVGGKKFSKSKTYPVKKNKKLTLTVTGKAKSVDNVYKVSDKKIAKITSKKTASKITVKALKKGKATVTVKVNGVKFSVKINVK